MIKPWQVLTATILILQASLTIGCKKTLVLVQDKALPVEKQSRLVVGRFLSVRAIDRVVDGEAKRIYSGYLGESDQILIEPGQYLLTTKLEYSESVQLSPNTTASFDIRPGFADTLLVSLEASESYELSNKFTEGNKWSPQIQKLPVRALQR